MRLFVFVYLLSDTLFIIITTIECRAAVVLQRFHGGVLPDSGS